jgi:ssDNA-binding Zn-finger/Zn-ribbon topoisomerase 1
MAKRNHHTNIVPNLCPVCSKEKGDFIVSKQARFKLHKPHTDGVPCPECQTKITAMARVLAEGGFLVVCTQCGAISVDITIPETLQKIVTEMPGGIKRLELAGCPLCIKEAANVQATETQSPDLGTQNPSHLADYHTDLG